MNQNEKATLESQLYGVICNAYDTEEMFWLRQNDDYQSKVTLGLLLSGQYRFQEAIDAFLLAKKVKADDASLYTRLGGAYLTTFHFEESKKAYNTAISLGTSKKSIAYPLGVWHYLVGDYGTAAKIFPECLPCEGEMKIAVIYWQMLSSLKCGKSPILADEYHDEMDVGHHTAYKLAVSVMLGRTDTKASLKSLKDEKDDLNYVVASYGIAEYLIATGKDEEGKKLIGELLKRKSVWPCISYLAALREQNVSESLNYSKYNIKE